MAGPTLPEKVAQIYYTYGLFISSYSVTAITLALSIVLLCCYPLLNVPLPGNIPTTVNLPIHELKTNLHHTNNADCTSKKCQHNDFALPLEVLLNETQKLPYLWAKDKPKLYIQQIILKIGVSPWSNNLRLWDAFRAPLHESFRLLETIRNHEDLETKTTILHQCYHIESIKKRDSRASLEHLLPEYGCLLLSPANLWQQNLQTFALDANIVTTIHNYQKGKVALSEMAFGMPLRYTGIKRYPLRRRPRVLQFAVTIFYEQYDHKFLHSLAKKLKDIYPLYRDASYKHFDDVTLIYYPGHFNYRELVPLLITFFGLFLYVYFSVRKIEFINSKFGLAACAVVTIAGSLTMSMGICFYFGFSLSLQGKEIFPYLVIIVGLENVLVLTKSVTSTDYRLDVKIRLAQGLNKEGWSITKNLLTEITIFTVSFFTFVPFIQEFSIFMIVSLLSDYFVQMVFFATILGIDVRRMDYFREQNTKFHLKEYFTTNNALYWRLDKDGTDDNSSPQRMTKSKSHPRLNGLAHAPTDVVAKRNSNPGHDQRVPKRIRLVNFWARTRFFQRAFMVWMIVWISMIVYNSGIVEYFIANIEKTENTEDITKSPENKEPIHPKYQLYNHNENSQMIFPPVLDVDVGSLEKISVEANDTLFLKHSPHSRPRISPYHWSDILSQYNESVAGGYVVVAPPVVLSHRVGPELAVSLRHRDERDPPPVRWQALAAALDPIDILPDFDVHEGKVPGNGRGQSADLPIYPTTPMEILLLAILCTISVAVIVYMMVVLYRCICSRHYAEWRASWNGDEGYERDMAKQPAVQLVMEAVPLVVSGHSQEVECLVTDGEKIVSSCLQGNVKVWDSQNGEIITNIDRPAYFKLQKELYEKINSKKDNTYVIKKVDSKSDLSSKPEENFHQLRKGLSTHLSGLRFRSISRNPSSNLSAAEKTKYNFAKNYRPMAKVGIAFCSCNFTGSSFPLSGKQLRIHAVTKIGRSVVPTQTTLNRRNYYRDLYCSNINNEFYNGHETKENVDINNLCIRENDYNSRCKDNRTNEQELFIFSHDESSGLPGSGNHKLNNGSATCDDGEKRPAPSWEWKEKATSESPVWCMDFCNDLIILGCADGRLEFWEATRGKLLCVWWNTETRRACLGVTHVKALSGARRVCVATLSGTLTLLRLDVLSPATGAQVDWRFSTAHRRTHKRSGSAGAIRTQADTEGATRNRMSFSFEAELSDGEEIMCARIAHCRPHQQPITEMQSEGGRILTGGQDHVLKVFSSNDLNPLFTLHGHCGPITSSFIDLTSPTIAGSGSQDGLLCVWDLHTGACLYSTQAHDGAVTSLAYTASYVVSAGSDERLCIWDRFQGHMLNSIHIGLNYMSRMLPLTHTLLVAGDRSGLTAYDLSTGHVIRRVLLGQSDGCILVRQILPLKDAIVCDYANQLRIVRFPLVSRLADMKSD